MSEEQRKVESEAELEASLEKFKDLLGLASFAPASPGWPTKGALMFGALGAGIVSLWKAMKHVKRIEKRRKEREKMEKRYILAITSLNFLLKEAGDGAIHYVQEADAKRAVRNAQVLLREVDKEMVRAAEERVRNYDEKVEEMAEEAKDEKWPEEEAE